MANNSSIPAKTLSCRTEVKIRFCEVDSLRIVWHGNYVKYLEDGREKFGDQYGIEYITIYKNGFTAPLVDLKIKYKQSVTIGDTIIVETIYRPTQAAKMVFDYIIYNKSDMSVVLTAETTQVFMSIDGELQLNTPEFFQKWKERWEC